MEANDMKALREALAPFPSLCDWLVLNAAKLGIPDMVAKLRERGDKARAALSAPPRKGKWKNGTKYEYEYAYCSECGRMQWAGWDTREQAKENIESFAHDYKFCPGCGAEMEGGVYVK